MQSIRSYNDLKYYLVCDKISRKEKRRYPRFYADEVWKLTILLRLKEYVHNCHVFFLIRIIVDYLFHNMSVKLLIELPLNTFAPGLSIAHAGNIIVNDNAKIGSNCRIHEGVTLGATNGSNKAPKIGDNVFLGSGCKIIGDIEVADNVAIGAGAVVVKDILEPGTTWGGVPAKKISNNDSSLSLCKATEIVAKLINRTNN